MEEAGGTIDDVVLQWVYLNDFAYQPYMVDVYLEAWPIGQYQAARKTFRYPMGGQIQIQCIGRIGGARSNHEIPGHGHHDPIPMGARIGDLYASSGVSGVDPSSADKLEPVEGAAGQAHFGIRNVRTLAAAGRHVAPTTSGTSPCWCRTTPTCRRSTRSGWRCFPTRPIDPRAR